MKRRQLFEFEDQPWFPDLLRQHMTNYLIAFHRLLGTEDLLFPLLDRALRESHADAIVDLCSGAGGPLPAVAHRLLATGLLTRVTLTDKFPNRSAMASINAGNGPVAYREEPVDAGAVPGDLVGLRTMIGSFHHMPVDVARRILNDAFVSRRALCVFEISDNAGPGFLWWLPLPFGFLMTYVVTLFVRPLSFGQLALTYLVPVLPPLIAWDGTASNARTYTPDDLRELTGDLVAPDYMWEIGVTRKKGYPGGACYVLGLPKAAP